MCVCVECEGTLLSNLARADLMMDMDAESWPVGERERERWTKKEKEEEEEKKEMKKKTSAGSSRPRKPKQPTKTNTPRFQSQQTAP